MTVRAAKRASVIPGIVGGAVHEDLRRKERGVVTVVALAHGHEMPRGFARGRNPVVAAHAAVDDAGVIEGCGAECEGRVADTAIAVSRKVIERLSNGEDAVVAAPAVVDDAGVIERCGCERQGRVASVAFVGGRQVVGRLTDGRHTVVTGYARAEHMGVIDLHRRTEGECRVAIFTHVVRCDVHRALADGSHAVVALDAVPRDACVFEPRGDPGEIRVAILALVGARNVVGILARCCHAVVAIAAGTQHVGVIDLQHGAEAEGHVAVFADVVGVDVTNAFADGLDAVVTRDAITRDAHMIEGGCLP